MSDNPWDCGCLINELKKHILERYNYRWTLRYDNIRCSTPSQLKDTAVLHLNHISDCAILFGARYGLSQFSEITILFILLVSIAIIASLFIFFIYYRREHKLKVND